MPVKMRWIIPNSLDKTSRLLRAGWAINFYPALVSISVYFEKRPGVEAPHWNKGNSGANSGMGRGRPPCLPADTCFPLLVSWCSGFPRPLLSHLHTTL